MTIDSNHQVKKYDLEERTLQFAKKVGDMCRSLSKDLVDLEYCKQLIRSSASIGANYIEANEALSKKDFLMRVKICRKEAKETVYWLDLLNGARCDENGQKIKKLTEEATELMKIFGSIVIKSQ